MNKDTHRKCIAIIEAIEHFRITKRHYIEGLHSYAGQFRWLKGKYEHKIVIIDMCIERMIERYYKLINIRDFEIKLQEELNKLPYEKHLDDGCFNNGVQYGFEMGARWALNNINR